MTCESCGLVGHASSFEELQYMRARHEERDALDSVSHAPLQELSFQSVEDSHSLTLAIERKEVCHSLNP